MRVRGLAGLIQTSLRGSTFQSGRSVRLRAGLRLQRGEEPLQTDLGAAADRAGDDGLGKILIAAIIDFRRPILIFKMKLFSPRLKPQSMIFKCYEGKRSLHLPYFYNDPLVWGMPFASPRC